MKLQVFNFIKKEILEQVFSCEFCEISKNLFFTEHLCATASALIQIELDVKMCLKELHVITLGQQV